MIFFPDLSYLKGVGIIEAKVHVFHSSHSYVPKPGDSPLRAREERPTLGKASRSMRGGARRSPAARRLPTLTKRFRRAKNGGSGSTPSCTVGAATSLCNLYRRGKKRDRGKPDIIPAARVRQVVCYKLRSRPSFLELARPTRPTAHIHRTCIFYEAASFYTCHLT